MTINRPFFMIYKFVSHSFFNNNGHYVITMISNQCPLVILKGIDNLVLMAITFTLLYVHFCPLLQDLIAFASFSFSFRSGYY